MLRVTVASILVVASVAVAGCSRSDAAVAAAPAPAQQRTVPPVSAPKASRLRLVFFMNPNGVPCQMQDRILTGMGSQLSTRAELVYYRTTEPSDLARFEEFGIRALPTLVVTDSNGVELRRGTPGIQSEAQVQQLLGP